MVYNYRLQWYRRYGIDFNGQVSSDIYITTLYITKIVFSSVSIYFWNFDIYKYNVIVINQVLIL